MVEFPCVTVPGNGRAVGVQPLVVVDDVQHRQVVVCSEYFQQELHRQFRFGKIGVVVPFPDE